VAGPSDVGNSFYLVQPNATFRGVLADAATDGVSVAVSDQAAIAVDYAGNVTFESFATGSVTRRDFSNLLLPDGSKPDGIFPSDGFVGYGGGFVGLLNLESFVEGASDSTATAMAYESDAPPATVPASSVPITPAVTTGGFPVVGAPASTVVHDPGLSSLMLVTTDGQSMSAESIVDLVGLPYGSFWVNDISVMNGQILVSYVEYDDDPETPNPTRVLVGTPNT